MGTEVSHPVPHGPSLIEKIEAKWHKAYDDWTSANPCSDPGEAWSIREALEVAKRYYRMEGIAAALGILRGTSTKHEMDRLTEEHTR